jgi:hypothetical protein
MKKESQNGLLSRPVDAVPDDFAGTTNPATHDKQEREIPSPTEPFENTWDRHLAPMPANVCKTEPKRIQIADKPFEIKESNVQTESSPFFAAMTLSLSRPPLPAPSLREPECSGWKSSATDPLHPNSNEINVRSGVAE